MRVPETPFVFVSYSHRDSPAVLPEVEFLRDCGFEVYYDDDVHPGSRWRKELAGAISKCSAFVLFLTPKSAESPICRKELSYALSKQRPIVSVHLEDTELSEELEFAIGDIQAILRSRLNASQFRERLKEAVADLVPSRNSTDQHHKVADVRRRKRWLLRIATAMALFVTIALVGWAAVRAWQQSEARHEQRVAMIDDVKALVRRDDYGGAFTRLRPLVLTEPPSPKSELGLLWHQIVSPMKPLVTESLASVYFKAYSDVDGPWIFAGTTPFDSWIDAPRGVLRVRVEKPGYVTGEFAIANPGPSVETSDVLAATVSQQLAVHTVPLELAREGTIPNGFVRVPLTDTPEDIVGISLDFLGDGPRVPPFAIARTEVTNSEFKAFVDAGGYDNETYWAGLRFVDDHGNLIEQSSALAKMVDQTGRHAPANWSLANYPDGQADYPVGGVSWYEAQAYARYRGMMLPTVHHWARASLAPYDGLYSVTPTIAAMSRLRAKSPGAEGAVGLGPWGTFNTAGNVREWVLNSAHTYALAMGGAWTDPPEMASTVFPTNPLDRSPQNGLRLMIELGAPEKANALLNPVTLAFEKGHFGDPIPDDEFEAVRSQFVADHPTPTHVDTKIVAQNDAWVAEEVTLMYAEAADKFVLYVVWPSVHAASLQAVIYAPSIGAFIAPAENAAALTEIRNVEFILRGGRALVIPVWSGAYERFAPPPANGEAQRKLMISWYRDLAKTLDYLKTRNDIDSDRIAIAGYSLGARVIVEPLIAIEGTLKTAVLISGGLQLGLPLDPAFEALNYAPRTVVPVLMINGQFDNVVPFAGQKAYFNALGTSAEDKRLVAFPNGHVDFPPNQEAAEVGDWLDKYLGPVGHNVVTNATQDQM